jgi:low affinity Fe/Cu permease
VVSELHKHCNLISIPIAGTPIANRGQPLEQFFSQLAQGIGKQFGKPYTFAAACLLVIIWAAVGPIFHYSDTWQLVINTSTTIITFLMVFLLQHGQNRDTRMIQLKLDELIRANAEARNSLLGLESLTEQDMRLLQTRFAALAKLGSIPEELAEAQEDLGKAQGEVSQARQKIGQVVDQAKQAMKPSDN